MLSVNYTCRLCGDTTTGDVVPIFSEEAHRHHVLLKIQTRLHLQISANDPLPKFVCLCCLGKLDYLWDFYEQCRRTQNKLREVLLKQHMNTSVAADALTFDKPSVNSQQPCSTSSLQPVKGGNVDVGCGDTPSPTTAVPECFDAPVTKSSCPEDNAVNRHVNTSGKKMPRTDEQ